MTLHPSSRWTSRALAVAIATVALATGCAQQPDQVGTAAGSDPSVTEGAAASTEQVAGPGNSKEYRVGDEHGIDATLTGAEIEDQNARIEDRLLIEGTGVDGVRPRYLEPPDDVEVAYQTLEAVELHDRVSGEIVGYWGGHFIPADEYPAELARAQVLVEQFEATSLPE